METTLLYTGSIGLYRDNGQWKPLFRVWGLGVLETEIFPRESQRERETDIHGRSRIRTDQVER